jgi:hypothetical protein
MKRCNLALRLMILLLLFSGYSISAHAVSVNFTTIPTSADKSVYALSLTDISIVERELLLARYFDGVFFDAADFESEQTYNLPDRDPINLQGLGELFDGTFFVTQFTHRISDSESGFETEFVVERDLSPLDTSGNTNINLLFSEIRLDTSVTTQGDSVISELTLSPVPIPAAFWLFGTGLIGLIGFSKRKKAA